MNQFNRRKFIGTAALLSVGAVAGAMPLANMKEKYPVIHHVFFWLKNPDSIADRNQLVAGLKTLSKIPTVKQIHVGIVASTEKRDVVDTSWSVSELIHFSDLEGQETYQTHPIHLEFIRNCSHLWAKVVVYDAVEA